MEIEKEAAIKDLLDNYGFPYEIFQKTNFDLFRDDRDVALVAVKGSGYSLKYTSARIKDDIEIVLAAVLASNREPKYIRSMVFKHSSPRIQALCKGQDPIEALAKAIEVKKLHAQLGKELSLPTPSLSIPNKKNKI